MTWISDMTTRIAEASGIDATVLAVGAADADELLRLAGVVDETAGAR